MKRYSHYFVNCTNACCVICGLNWRFLRLNPFCEKNTIKYKKKKFRFDGFSKKYSMVTGGEIIRMNNKLRKEGGDELLLI